MYGNNDIVLNANRARFYAYPQVSVSLFSGYRRTYWHPGRKTEKHIFQKYRQRGFAEFIKKLFDQLRIVFLRTLAGHYKPYRFILDRRQDLHFIHCFLRAAHKLKKREVAVQKNFQLSGIIMSV